MLDAGVLLVRVFHRVLVGGVRADLNGDFLGNDLANFVAIFSFNIAELIV
jgi:hypothetical protein